MFVLQMTFVLTVVAAVLILTVGDDLMNVFRHVFVTLDPYERTLRRISEEVRRAG